MATMERTGSLWLVVLGLAGCNLSMTPASSGATMDRDLDREFESTGWGHTPLDVGGGRLQGRIGEVDLPGDQTPMLSGWKSSADASLELHAAGTGGAGMVRLVLTPGLDHPALVPGARLRADAAGVVDVGGEDQLWIAVIACSGPSDGDWLYDQSPDSTELTVEDADGDGAVELSFTGTFERWQTSSGHPETVTGGFSVGETRP